MEKDKQISGVESCASSVASDLDVNVSRTDEKIDTRLTQLRSLKVLYEGYQAADDYNKPAIGWYLRKVYGAFITSKT